MKKVVFICLGKEINEPLKINHQFLVIIESEVKGKEVLPSKLENFPLYNKKKVYGTPH